MSKEFMQHYQSGLESLQDSAEVFSRFAAQLGHPTPNMNIPTAQVSWDRENKRTSFEINPEFFAPLAPGERGAVIAHETYHVLLQHFEDTLDPHYKNQEKLYIAQECIINDGLEDSVGLTLPEDENNKPVYGKDLFNKDFSYFTSRQGYDFIVGEENLTEPENSNNTENDENSDSVDNGTSSSSEAGCGEESASDNPNSMKAHACGGVQIMGENDDLTANDVAEMKKFIIEKVHEAVKGVAEDEIPDELIDAIIELDGDNAGGYGLGGGNSAPLTAAPERIDVNWRKLLAKINPKINDHGRRKNEDSWARPNMRYISVYPHVVMPGVLREPPTFKGKGDSRPTLIVALDLSYSIPRELVNKLVSMVDETPEQLFNAIPVTWSDNVVEYDKTTKKITPPGGTEIDNLYQWVKRQTEANQNLKNPYVLVITDGGCKFYSRDIDVEYVKNRWFWCGIDDGDMKTIVRNFSEHIQDNHVYQLSEFQNI